MSLEIQDNFAASYARHSGNKGAWQVNPEMISYNSTDWFSAWLIEHETENLGKEYTHSPHPEPVIRELFGRFFTSLRERNHVHIPEDVQKSAILAYLED